VEAGQGKIILGLGGSDLILILRVKLFGPFHSQVPFLHELAFSCIPSIQQTLQLGSMSSSGGRTLGSQFLQLRLKLNLNLGQFGGFSLGSFELGGGLAELFIFFSELALQLGDPFLCNLKFGAVSGSS